MPYETQTSDFWGWYLRHNNRTVWKHLQDAGIDVFSSGPSNNQQAFLDITNILPAMNGGFYRRWGVDAFASNSGFSGTPTITRTFAYNFPQDASNPSGTANTNLIIATDNQNLFTFTDSGAPFSGNKPTSGAVAGGTMYAVNSRGYFYYGDGVNTPRKVNPSMTTVNTDSTVGIDIAYFAKTITNPTLADYPNVQTNGQTTAPGVTLIENFTGYGYTTAPIVTVFDTGGTGSGCTILTTLGPHGEVRGVAITNPGSGYTQADASLTAPPPGGIQANLTLYVQTNSAAPNFGEVVGVDLAGNLQFVSGRKYTVALQNSITGHTSDVFTTNVLQTPVTGPVFNQLTSVYTAAEIAVGTNIPIYIASSNTVAGVSGIETVIAIPGFSDLDPQVDTVILLAAADGQSVGTLYQVAIFPLSSFTVSSNTAYLYYLDTLPDTFNDQNTSGNTLLASDLWAFTDSAGDEFGILLNTPPTTQGFLYPLTHQGRMFATDGKTVFFSKSIDEVTTSTGLITSKWEECWPGDYQLPIALNNETILGMKSDGTNLHVGTDQNMFTVYGSDPSNFDVPSVAFAQTGILSNDCWTVVYAEGQPSGFVWLTQDLKVIHSDFSTYREIGTPITPILQAMDHTKIQQAKVLSLTQGPYNLVILQFFITGSSSPQPEFLIWETRLQKWYRWLVPPADVATVGSTTNVVDSSFIYQFSGYTSSGQVPGSKFLFYWQTAAGPSSNTVNLRRFNPALSSDTATSSNIIWNVQTSWQDFGDCTSIKCMNEIEATGDDIPYAISLFGATSQTQFDSGGVLLKSGNTVKGPIASQDTNKLYCAGSPTSAKYYSIQLSPSGNPVAFLTLTDGGTGYSGGPPTVALVGGGGSGATAGVFMSVSGDSVARLFLIDPGSGYTSNPTVVFSGGSGSGAAGTATVITTADTSAPVLTSFSAEVYPMARI
jgi:hypothetical protein